jgi:uncharacterized protein (DUF1330 family)
VSAFLVATYDVLNSEALGAYREAAIPLLCGPGRGRLLVATDRTRHLPGSCGGTHTVIIGFERVEQAERIYHDPEYQKLLALRMKATQPRAEMIVCSLE